MLSATLAVEARTESRARCAYRAVVCTWVWPNSLPIIGKPSPSASALLAYECRKS